MSSFDESRLGELTRSIFRSEERWRKKNWEETLSSHGDELEPLLEHIAMFDKWKGILKFGDVSEQFMPEIFIDGWASVHLACFALYKYAHMSLRSELESALRLVYFSSHPVEYSWWAEGNESYRNILRSAHVWGDGYIYFSEQPLMKKLEESCQGKHLFKGKDSVPEIHKSLSKFIHSGAGHFQTSPGRMSPKYDRGRFGKWKGIFQKVQTKINVILIAAFPNQFKSLRSIDREEIISGVIGNYYAEKIRELLSL